MIKIEHIETYGWEAAVRGMRNPKNSWDKSDSHHEIYGMEYYGFTVGENDLALMKKLVNAGTDHSKFMRMIGVSFDLTAPEVFWSQFDTYKVGTVANSCSKMHRIHTKELTVDDFSLDGGMYDENGNEADIEDMMEYHDIFEGMLTWLNKAREKYNETGDKRYWRILIQLLPMCYNQKRTITMNYAVLRNMYHARKNHRLDEWRDFCKSMEEKLPYSELITM